MNSFHPNTPGKQDFNWVKYFKSFASYPPKQTHTSQQENKEGIGNCSGRELITRAMQKQCWQKGGRERQKQINKARRESFPVHLSREKIQLYFHLTKLSL